MANDRNLKVNLDINANSKQAQAEVQKLINDLQKLKVTPSLSIDNESLKKARSDINEIQSALQKAFNVDTGKLDLSKFSNSLSKANISLGNVRENLLSIKGGSQVFSELTKQISMAEAPTLNLNKNLKEFAGTLANTFRWQISSSFLHGAIGAIQSAIGYAKELDESLNRIQIVTGKSDIEMAKFAESANKAAQALSTTTNRYAEASLIYFQQGLSAEEVEKRTAVTIKMANVTGDTAETVSQQLTAVWNNFYDGSKSLEYFADGMTALGAATATSSAEIAEGLQKFASIGQTVGLSYEYAASALATITATTRESADTVGNALKTLFARIQGLNLGETLEDGTTLNKYSGALAKVGVSIKDAKGELKDMDQILDELGDRWQQLSRDQQVALAQTVAGQRQYAQFMNLMSNWDFMKTNLKTVNESAGTLQRQADIYAKSWEAASTRVRASLESIYSELVNADVFTGLADSAEKAISLVDNLIKGIGGLPGIITLVSSLVVGKFSKEIPEAVDKTTDFFKTLFGIARKEALETQQILNESLKPSTNAENRSSSYNFQIEKYKQLGELQLKLNQNEKNLSDTEKLRYENQIKQLEAIYDGMEKLREETEKSNSALKAAEKELNNLGNAASSINFKETKTTDYLSDLYGLDTLDEVKKSMKDLISEASEADAILSHASEAVLTWGGSYEEVEKKALSYFSNLKDQGHISEEAFEKLQIQIKATNGDVDALQGVLQEFTDDMGDGLQNFLGKSGTALADLNYQINDVIEDLRDSEGATEATKKLADSLEKFWAAALEAKLRTKELNESLDEAKNSVSQGFGEHIASVSEDVGKLVSNLAAVGTGLTSFKSLVSTVSNSELSVWEKWIRGLASLPGILNTIKSIGNISNLFSSVALGPVGPILAAIAGIATAFGAVKMAIDGVDKANKEALKNLAESAKKAAEESEQLYESKKQEYDENEKILDSYEELLKVYKENKTGKADLIEAGEALIEKYGAERENVKLLNEDYQGLLDTIKEVNLEESNTLTKQSHKNYLTQRDAFSATMLASDQMKQENTYALGTDVFNDQNAFQWIKDAVQNPNIDKDDLERFVNQAVFINSGGLEGFKTLSEQTQKVILDVVEAAKESEDPLQALVDGLTKVQEEANSLSFDNVIKFNPVQIDSEAGLFIKEKLEEFKNENITIGENGEITFKFPSGEEAETAAEFSEIIDSILEDIDLDTIPNEKVRTEIRTALANIIPDDIGEFIESQKADQLQTIDNLLANAGDIELKNFSDYENLIKNLVESAKEVASFTGKSDEELYVLIDSIIKENSLIDTKFAGQQQQLESIGKELGVSVEEINDLVKKLAPKTQDNLNNIDLDLGAKIYFNTDDEEVKKKVVDNLNSQAKNISKVLEKESESGSIAEALSSLENITLTKSTNSKNFNKLREQLDWGELGIIPWDEFARKDRQGQIDYLASLKVDLKEAQDTCRSELIDLKTKQIFDIEELQKTIRELISNSELDEATESMLTSLNNSLEKSRSALVETTVGLIQEKSELERIEEESAKGIISAIQTEKLEIGDTLSIDETEAFNTLQKILGFNIDDFVEYTDEGKAVITKNVDELAQLILEGQSKLINASGEEIKIFDIGSLEEAKQRLKDNSTIFTEEDYKEAIQYLDAMGLLKLTLEDLEDVNIKEALGDDKLEEYTKQIDLSKESLDDLLERLKDTEKGEVFNILLKEILSRDDLTTAQAIEAITEALKNGTDSAEEFINKTKEYLTVQEQLAELRGRETTDKDFSGYASLAGNEDLSFEERSQAIEGMVESIDKLKESGKHANEEMKELYDRQLSLLESNDSGFTMVENLEELADAMARGTLDFEHYEEGMKKILESERDWTMSEDAVIATLMNLEVVVNKANGTLEQNAKIIGENCESMEDYEVLVSSLEKNEASSEATKRATASALLKLAKNYDECKDEMHKYEEALRSGNQELQKSAKSALEFSIRCSEIAKNTGKTQAEIKSLAQSYKDLYQTIDENGKIMDISDEVAADLAERYININEGIKDLQQNWESYNEVLDALQQGMDPTNAMTMNDVFVDQAENLEKLREAMAQVLNMTDASAISNEFLAMNADLVTRAMEGEASAVEELQIRMAEKLMLEVGIDDSQFREIANSVGKTCDDIRGWLTTLPEGQLSLDNMQFLQALIDAMVAAGMTKEDIENKLSGIGFDLDLEPYNQDLQDMVDNADTAGSALATIAGKTAKTTVEAGSIDSEATIESKPFTEMQQGIDWEQVEDPKSVRGSIVIPTISEITGIGNVISGFQTKFYEQVYPGIKVQAIPRTATAQKTATGIGLKLKSGSYSKGGNISFKNSSGGNKPATTTASSSSAPRSSSSGSTSTPRPTTVSGGAISPIAQTVHEALDIDKFSMEDYRQKKVQKDLPNYEEYDEEVYTTRKKYYNERYNKHKTFDEPEYQTKDESNFLVLSDEIDLYYDETHALEKLSAQLQEIETRKSRAFGKAHLDAIAEERANIEQTIETQQAYLDKLGARGEELQKALSKQGFTFSDDGRITNNEEVITDKLLERNLGVERMIEKSNELETETVNALNEAKDEWNKGSDAITDFVNEASNEAYDRANERLEHIDNVQNSKSKQIKDRINKALKDAAEGKYDKQTAAQNTYEDIVEEAGNKKNRLLDEIVKERNEALEAEDEIKEMRLDSAKDEYLRIKNMYEGTYTDSDMAEIARSELSEAKTKYDNLVKEIEQDAETAYKEINNKANARIKEVEKDFTETEKIAKNVMEQSKDGAEYMSDVAIQNAKHVQAVSERNLKNWINREKQSVEDELDETTHEIQNAEADLKETNDARFEERTKEIEKTREQRQDLIDLEMDSIKDSYDKVIEQRDEFDQISQQYDEVAQQIQENKNRLYDLNLEEIDYTLELKVRLSDEVVKALDSLLDSLGDFADKAADKIAILGSKMYQFAVQTNATRDAVRDLLNSTNLVDDAVVARFMTGSYTEDDLQALFNVDQFTSDKVAQLEGYRDQLISLISEQRNLKNEMFDTVMTAFNEYQEKLDLQIEKISTLTKFTETYRNIVGIVGKKVLDASGELSEKLARNAFDTQRSQTKVYKTILDELDSNIADMKYKQKNYDLDSEMYRDFQERIDEMEAKRRQAQENWLSSWQAEMQAAADYYADAIDTITMVLDRSVSGLMDSLELLRQEYDRQKQISEVYVEDYEKIYQLNKLNRQVEAAIDDSEHIKNKQRLKKLQEEINNANQDGVKLSQYDLDVLQKKFELEMARSELEEATNAKSQVRMMRDAEGNYGFVYTADANAVADAEQNYEDKLHELQVLNTDYIKQLEENYLELQQNVRDQLANLDITQFATEEEYLAEVNRIQQAALELQDRYGQQMTNATNNNQDLYNNDWKTYSEMTGYKISADEDYLDKFQETQTAVLTGFKSMEEQHQIFADSIAKATSSMIEAYRATQEMQQLAMQDGDTSMDNFASDAAKTIDKVGTQTEQLADEAIKLSEQFRDSFSDIADNAKNFADNYVKNIQPAIDASQKLLTTISDIISHQADLGGIAASTSGGSGGQNSGTTSSGTKNWNATETEASLINAKSDIGEYLPFIGAVLQYTGYDTDYNGWGNSETRKGRLEQVFGEGAVDDINKWMSEHAGDDSKNYYVAIADKLEKYSYETLGRMLGAFDTGGYTGSWGSSGRLAMLHEKELVLNKEDTSNILGAVDMVRNIAQVIDLNARATNQAMSTAFNAASVSSGNQVFEQQVTINADFPNATDRDEIIAAFDNLTNLAMQYAGRA